MINFLILCVLIMPWVIFPSGNIIEQMRVPQALFFDFTCLGIMFFTFKDGLRIRYRNKFFAFLNGWVFLNFFLFFMIPFAIVFKNGNSVSRVINVNVLEPMIHYFLGMFAVYSVISTASKEDFIRIAKAVCISCTLVASYCILQVIGLEPLKFIGAKYHCANIISGCLDNPNVVANYLVLGLPLFLIFSNFTFLFMMVVSSIVIGLSDSRFAIAIALSILCVNLLIHARKKIYYIGAMFLATVGSLYYAITHDFFKFATGFSGRLECWKIAIEHLKDNVLFGQGIGCWKQFGVKIQSTWWMYVHNDWLERTVEFGVIGLFFLATLVVTSILNADYKAKESRAYLISFIALVIMMIGSFPFETATVAFLGLLAFCAIENMKGD